jgi:hypothetical protein
MKLHLQSQWLMVVTALPQYVSAAPRGLQSSDSMPSPRRKLGMGMMDENSGNGSGECESGCTSSRDCDVSTQSIRSERT